MKAAVFYGPVWPQKPVVIEERPVPAPGAGEILVKVAACGMCRSDLDYLKGENATLKPPPIVLGHEPVGTIAECGPGVTGFTAGQKVLVAYPIPCLRCEQCRRGRENLCSNLQVTGVSRDGAFAEYVAVPAITVFPLPEGLPLEQSAIIADAVATSFHAINDVANVRPGQTVAVFGASGGVGLICVQLARAAGASVIGVGRKQWKLEAARELGAEAIINCDEVERVSREVRKITGGGVEIAFDVTGRPEMIEEAFRSTRPGGKLVVIGASSEKIQLELPRLLWQELSVFGAKNYNLSDMPRVLKLVANGAVNLDKSVSHRFQLDQFNEAYQALDRGEILRGIIVP